MVPSDGIIAILIKGVVGTIFGGVFLAVGAIAEIVKAIRSGDLSKIDGKFAEKIMSYDYKTELSPDIFVNEEGIIKVGGTIKVDNEELTIPEIVI